MAFQDPSSSLVMLDSVNTFFTNHPTLLTIIVIWALVWKGLALWKSSKNNSKLWFIALLIINTFGILEILYIFLFSRLSYSQKEIPKSPKKSRKK